MIFFPFFSQGNYLCYVCRKVSAAFSETKYIGIAMVSNIQVLALGIPVVLIVAEEVLPNYFVRAGVIFLNDFTVLALIFFPKILHVSFGFDILPEDGSMSTRAKTGRYAPQTVESDANSNLSSVD